jgi:hypothetical protein
MSQARHEVTIDPWIRAVAAYWSDTVYPGIPVGTDPEPRLATDSETETWIESTIENAVENTIAIAREQDGLDLGLAIPREEP